jgi:hypothetical protein
MPAKYFQKHGFVVDVERLVSSYFLRWVAEMDVREVNKYHRDVSQHDDVTGNVVIIGGLGVVDGFRTLDEKKKGMIPVIIFELRNAQRFIYHEIGPIEKDENGMFKARTIVGERTRMFDLYKYQGHFEPWNEHVRYRELEEK